MKGKKYKDVNLQAITMIDSGMGCIEICSVPEARAGLVSNQKDSTWQPRNLLLDKTFID